MSPRTDNAPAAIARRAASEVPLRIEEVRQLLAECKDVDVAKGIRDKAAALARWYRSQKASKEIQNGAGEAKVRAERKIGELLEEQAETGQRQRRGDAGRAAANGPEPKSQPATLEEIGIDKHASARFRQVAAIPEERFEKALERQKSDPQGEVTTAGTIREADRKNPHAASRVGDEADRDRKFTPRALIEALHREFRFTVDASSELRAPSAGVIGNLWTREDDGLEQGWQDERLFVNCEWSALPDWVRKTHEEVERGGCPLVVHLMPGNRTEQEWWHKYVEPYRPDRGGSGVRVRCIEGRINYGNPDDLEGEHSRGVGFPSILVIWEGERRRSPEFPEEVVEGTVALTAPQYRGKIALAEEPTAAKESAPKTPSHYWERQNHGTDFSKAVYRCKSCQVEVIGAENTHESGGCLWAMAASLPLAAKPAAAEPETWPGLPRSPAPRPGDGVPTLQGALAGAGTISCDEFRQVADECGFRTKLTSGRAFGPAEEEYFTSRCQEVGCEAMFRTRKEDGHVLRFDLEAIQEHHKLHGPFCGAQLGREPWDRKKNSACIHRKGHAGLHSNGRRTWRGETPKRGKK